MALKGKMKGPANCCWKFERHQVYGIDIATTNSGIAYADSFILKEHHRQVLLKHSKRSLN